MRNARNAMQVLCGLEGGPPQCDQCVVHPAVGWLVTKHTVQADKSSVLQVRALCREYLDAWVDQLQENGAEVSTYPISDAQKVYDLLEKEDPRQLINFESSFWRKER